MNRTYRIWYLLVVLLTLVPAGGRMLWWQKIRHVSPAMARAGEELFLHEWTPNDPLCPKGDGLGPVYNAVSCVACHNQVRPGGGGGLEHNVTSFTLRIKGQIPRDGVVHAYGVGKEETLRDIHPDLPGLTRPTLKQVNKLETEMGFPTGTRFHLSQRNTPALFGAKLIDEIPSRVILAGARSQQLMAQSQIRIELSPMSLSLQDRVPAGLAFRLPDGRVGRFGWKAQMASLSDFVQAACANELGLGNPGQGQPVPLYEKTAARSAGLDLTLEHCNQLTSFCASLPRPIERLTNDASPAEVMLGKQLFSRIGCADCHTPKLGSVDGIYSDLLLHDMGAQLVGGGSYGVQPVPVPNSPSDDGGPLASEWRTPPLWGVADSAPYLHDGRAATLEEAIQMHGGQGSGAARGFLKLADTDKAQLFAFLGSLRAP